MREGIIVRGKGVGKVFYAYTREPDEQGARGCGHKTHGENSAHGEIGGRLGEKDILQTIECLK